MMPLGGGAQQTEEVAAMSNQQCESCDHFRTGGDMDDPWIACARLVPEADWPDPDNPGATCASWAAR